MTSEKRLLRSRKALIGGVCAGVADYFNVDPVIVRIIMVVFTLASGGLLGIAYILLWIVLPLEPKEEARIAAAEQAKAEQEAAAARDAASDAVASLPEVDFSVGKEAFVSEWTSRINAYLAGSPLAGQGATFAEAAWSNGVDPRWSPAISNTESSKGAHCFLPYNAWGWGDKSWSSWEEAINAHVAGLANGYGYSITYANAAKYCPPNTDHWFKATIGQMKMI